MTLCLTATFASTTPALASELDPNTGELASTDPGAILIGFEDPAQLANLGVALTVLQHSSGYQSTLAFVDAGGAAMTSDELTAHLATHPAVEGTHALLLGHGPADSATGILVPWSKLSSSIQKKKIRVTVWVRSDGGTPLLTATYGTGTLPDTGAFTSVTAMRTGRETSDGWAELTTGPIDTSIWDVPLSQITVSMSGSDTRRNPNAMLEIDALEIVPLDGTPLAATPCTIATQDAACGSDGECQFGHCIPAYASWGPTPSAAQRADFVDRWISLAQHVQGARNSAQNAQAMLDARSALTATGVGGRTFFAGMMGLVNGLRNHHTSFDSPPNSGVLQPLAAGMSSSTLGACLGFGELDLLEPPGSTNKTLGFIVYKAAASSQVGVPLEPGDAITKIDGIDPLSWVRSVYLTYSPGVPADPGADLAWSAPSVGWMISHRASTVEITRCALAGACTGNNKTVLQVDVAGPTWKNIKGTGSMGNENDPNLLDCDVRFHDAVTVQSGSGGYANTVSTQTIWNDVLGVQFDGTMADFATWEQQVVPPFSTTPSPTKVLFDVRQGNGGYAENAELIAEEIRSKSQPVGQIDFPVATWDGSATAASLIDLATSASPSCESPTSSAPECSFIIGYYFLGDWLSQAGYAEKQVSPSTPLTAFTPGGLDARVAWLQAADVSANDYLAALVEGRSNQRVFAPGPTSGAFGTISSVAPLLLGWHGGSIQMTDSIWGPSPSTLATKPFRSGMGVMPDEIVAEKMSDAIKGVDTMLEAARAWLESGTP